MTGGRRTGPAWRDRSWQRWGWVSVRPSPGLRRWGATVVLAAAVAVGAGACGSDGGAGGDSAAERGAAVAADVGCAACHGDQGQGGVGPALRGLAGSTVELEDGRQVRADAAYIRRSIVDPEAERVAGYSARMPQLDLSGDQVDDLVAYVESLRG